MIWMFFTFIDVQVLFYFVQNDSLDQSGMESGDGSFMIIDIDGKISLQKITE